MLAYRQGSDARGLPKRFGALQVLNGGGERMRLLMDKRFKRKMKLEVRRRRMNELSIEKVGFMGQSLSLARVCCACVCVTDWSAATETEELEKTLLNALPCLRARSPRWRSGGCARCWQRCAATHRRPIRWSRCCSNAPS